MPKSAIHTTVQQVTILEDEPSIRELVCEVLTTAGYDTLHVRDGSAGLRILQSGTTVDLLMTDVGLPGAINGLQMADAARITRRVEI